MNIKIVTDSTADLPPGAAEKLGITIVPEILRFGDEIFRDNVDITPDEFYRRLTHDPIHPKTTQSSPQDFTDAYQALAPQADAILSIHISAKLSGTYNSAVQGAKAVKCPIEVVDSQVVTMGLGQLVIAASKLAESGMNLQQAAAGVKKMIPGIRILGLLDTLKYLALGGRISKAQALIGSALNVKPLLTIKNGLLKPTSLVRSRVKGMDVLYNFAKNAPDIQDLAVIYNTQLEEAQDFVKRLGALYPEEKITLSQLGPALGVHTGPGILFVAVRSKTG
ncbi:MAG TPA: DegV family protein [Dehalococcoidales bacterium]|nr:DegV family protein [Dehalococcoidales bacterium]